jgi:hypothetical protein
MSFSLERFGWDGVTVPAELKDIGRHLPTAVNLKLLRNPQTMGGAEVYFPFNFFHKGPEKYMPAYMKDVKLNDGGYATAHHHRCCDISTVIKRDSSRNMIRAH